MTAALATLIMLNVVDQVGSILYRHFCLEPAALSTLIMLNVADQVGKFFIIIIFV